MRSDPPRAALAALDRAAVAAIDRAYAPYSRFHVGAALLDERGRVHAAGNIENASYPVGMCAERAALAVAISSGARRIVAVSIATGLRRPVPPCGMCRQALDERLPDRPGRSGEQHGARPRAHSSGMTFASSLPIRVAAARPAASTSS